MPRSTPRLSRLISSLITAFVLLFLSFPAIAGVVNLADIKPETYRAQLDELNSRSALSETEKLTRNDLVSILETITQYEQAKAMYERVQEAAKNSPATISEFQQKKEKLEKEYARKKLPDLSRMKDKEIMAALHEIRQQREETMKLLEEDRKKLTSINAISEYTQRNEIQYQDSIHNNKQKISDGNLRPLEEMALQAQISYCEYYLQYLQFLNSAHNSLQELVSARIAYYQYKLDRETEIKDKYTLRMDQIRSDASLLEDMELQMKQAEIKVPENARSASSDYLEEENRNYLVQIRATIVDINSYSRENRELAKILETASKVENNVNSLIDTLSDSLFLSQMMAIQQKSIPEFVSAYNAEELLSEVRLEQYDLNTKEMSIRNPQEYREYLKRKYDETWDEAQSAAVDKLLIQQQELLEQYKDKLYKKVNILVNIQMNTSMYQRTKQNINDTINKKVFWLQSNQRFSINWLKNLPAQVHREVTGTEFFFSGKKFLVNLFDNIHKILGVFLISLVIIMFHQRMDDRISQLNAAIGSYRKDRHINTAEAVFLTALRCANWACWSLIVGWLLKYMTIRIGTYDIGEVASTDNGRIALLILLISITRFTLGPHDICRPHFGLNISRGSCRTHICFLILLAVLSLSCTCKTLYPHTFATDVIGQIIFFVLLLAIFLIMLRYAWDCVRNPASSLLTRTVLIGAAFIPASLLGFLCMGYFYSTVKLAERFIDTYFLIVLWVVIYFIIVRSLSVTSRRMAFRRKLDEREQKRREKLAEEHGRADDDTEAAVEADEMMPVSDISKQAQSITKISMFTIAAVIIYFIWADFITIISYLDNINLWSVTSGDPTAGVTTRKISLGDLLISVYTLIMMVLFVQNMPGLLEITVLNRFNATRRVSYSIKTLFTYIIIALGLSLSLSRLGVSWEKLQWLVAALSVGLGFGLQEIFANFVSGIIILFERPVRLGDVVTINGTTGIVSRIRIRATTIVDFDKKDLIIPNKIFITSQLTNWSLNEECLTRMIIKVGVGYGSDVRLVHDTLMRIAERNRFVLRTPPFYVVFIGFGDSNLDFQLMVFIEKIKDYYPTIDSLNTDIYNEFSRLGIEIAFNQVDLFIKNTRTGDEVRVLTGTEQEESRQAKEEDPDTGSESRHLPPGKARA